MSALAESNLVLNATSGYARRFDGIGLAFDGESRAKQAALFCRCQADKLAECSTELRGVAVGFGEGEGEGFHARDYGLVGPKEES